MPLRGVVARWCECRPHKVVGGLPHPGARLRSLYTHPHRPRLFSLRVWFFLEQGWKVHPKRQAFRLRVHSAFNAEAHRRVGSERCRAPQVVREEELQPRDGVHVRLIDICNNAKIDFDGVPQQHPRGRTRGRHASDGGRTGVAQQKHYHLKKIRNFFLKKKKKKRKRMKKKGRKKKRKRGLKGVHPERARKIVFF